MIPGFLFDPLKTSSSPYINRFLQPDTIIPDPSNPQALNRYGYVLNNPLRYIDPTGHRPEDGYVGNHGRHNCNKYSKYCEGSKLMSREKLAELRPGQCKTISSCYSGSFSGEFPAFSPVPSARPEVSYTNYSSTEDFYLAGYDYQINWGQVDWYHLITNGSGIAGDVTTALTVVGIVPAAPVAEFTQLIDGLGVTTDVIDFVAEGEFSGLSLDVAEYVFKETKAVRIIPIIGFSSNIKGFFEALYRGSTKTPIWRRKPNTSAQP